MTFPITGKRKLSNRYTVEVMFSENGLKVEWSPHYPTSVLTESEIDKYRDFRDSIIKKYMRKNNIVGPVIVAEV